MQIRDFHVEPWLPDRIRRLLELAYNLWWTWHPDAGELFARIDASRFFEVDRNPVRLLGDVPQERLERLASDASFLEHHDRVLGQFDAYLARPATTAALGARRPRRIGYFAAEYGLHECLPLYSGGLGILSGDTLKAGSDLDLPVVAVGLAYRFGYFQQRIGEDGTQHEAYPENDFHRLPMTLVRDETGRPLLLGVEMGARHVQVRIWLVRVGRIPLYLLDSNVPGRPEEDRRITAHLYGGDRIQRLEQEILLGIGGVHALHAVGHPPDAYHMNEGHSTLLSLEQISRLMDRENFSFEQARRLAAAVNVFTTHTPVAAGHDEFDPDIMAEYLAPYAERLGMPIEDIVALGQEEGEDEARPFSMTVLGLRMARHRNAVSRLHGEVSREMWHHLWPDLEKREVPISQVTNGVHSWTWLAPEMAELYDRFFEPGWSGARHRAETWEQVREIPDEAIWDTRCRLRHRLIHEVRVRLRRQLLRSRSPDRLLWADQALDPEILTVGFCRRFATYKRATLLFQDMERLTRILTHARRPIQFIFAGKAHPQDEPGKQFIRRIVHESMREEFRGKIVFVEGYDMGLARLLVQGVDVWLNNPRRPLEASGTSGMKVAFNGGLNLSILDGWWCEGYRGDNGWAIGNGDEPLDPEIQDAMDANALYELLESELAPIFYRRNAQGIPRDWCQRMKASIASICPYFNTRRMVQQYADEFYAKALQISDRFTGEQRSRLKELTSWWESVNESWTDVDVVEVDADLDRPRNTGEAIPVSIRVRSEVLEPAELAVEIVHGPVDEEGRIVDADVTAACYQRSDEAVHTFAGSLPCSRSGRLGMAVRLRPNREDVDSLWDRTLFRWG